MILLSQIMSERLYCTAFNVYNNLFCGHSMLRLASAGFNSANPTVYVAVMFPQTPFSQDRKLLFNLKCQTCTSL